MKKILSLILATLLICMLPTIALAQDAEEKETIDLIRKELMNDAEIQIVEKIIQTEAKAIVDFLGSDIASVDFERAFKTYTPNGMFFWDYNFEKRLEEQVTYFGEYMITVPVVTEKGEIGAVFLVKERDKELCYLGLGYSPEHISSPVLTVEEITEIIKGQIENLEHIRFLSSSETNEFIYMIADGGKEFFMTYVDNEASGLAGKKLYTRDEFFYYLQANFGDTVPEYLKNTDEKYFGGAGGGKVIDPDCLQDTVAASNDPVVPNTDGPTGWFWLAITVDGLLIIAVVAFIVSKRRARKQNSK